MTATIEWTIYLIALWYWTKIFLLMREAGDGDVIRILPSFMILGMTATFYTVVSIVSTTWSLYFAQAV